MIDLQEGIDFGIKSYQKRLLLLLSVLLLGVSITQAALVFIVFCGTSYGAWYGGLLSAVSSSYCLMLLLFGGATRRRVRWLSVLFVLTTCK